MNKAILKHEEAKEKIKISNYSKIDEIPFDYSRRKLSVIVKEDDKRALLICTGAVEEIISSCSNVLVDGEVVSLKDFSDERKLHIEKELNTEGFRVIAVAYKETPLDKKVFAVEDENNLIFVGFLAFFDPPKSTAKKTILDLKNLGVAVKILTGDNELVTEKICKDVGLNFSKILLGKDIEKLSDQELGAEVEQVTVFAKLSPYDKERNYAAQGENPQKVIESFNEVVCFYRKYYCKNQAR
jgi:Mg2+-importing ATPase